MFWPVILQRGSESLSIARRGDAKPGAAAEQISPHGLDGHVDVWLGSPTCRQKCTLMWQELGFGPTHLAGYSEWDIRRLVRDWLLKAFAGGDLVAYRRSKPILAIPTRDELASVGPTPTPADPDTWFEVRIVWDDTGAPISGVSLVVDPGRGGSRNVQTGSDGRARVEHLAPGRCEVRCSTSGTSLDECAAFAGMGEVNQIPVPPTSPKQRRSPKTVAVVKQHRVQRGESLESIAKQCGLKWEELATFNFGSSELDSINLCLERDLGCEGKIEKGKAHLFKESDEPGLLYVPQRWSARLSTSYLNVIRVKPVERLRRYGRCVDAARQPISGKRYAIYVAGKERHAGLTTPTGWLLAPFPYEKNHNVRFREAGTTHE